MCQKVILCRFEGGGKLSLGMTLWFAVTGGGKNVLASKSNHPSSLETGLAMPTFRSRCRPVLESARLSQTVLLVPWRVLLFLQGPLIRSQPVVLAAAEDIVLTGDSHLQINGTW